MEIVDEVFISVDGFFSDVLLGEEVGVGWSGGCFPCMISFFQL